MQRSRSDLCHKGHAVAFWQHHTSPELPLDEPGGPPPGPVRVSLRECPPWSPQSTWERGLPHLCLCHPHDWKDDVLQGQDLFVPRIIFRCVSRQNRHRWGISTRRYLSGLKITTSLGTNLTASLAEYITLKVYGVMGSWCLTLCGQQNKQICRHGNPKFVHLYVIHSFSVLKSIFIFFRCERCENLQFLKRLGSNWLSACGWYHCSEVCFPETSICLWSVCNGSATRLHCVTIICSVTRLPTALTACRSSGCWQKYSAHRQTLHVLLSLVTQRSWTDSKRPTKRSATTVQGSECQQFVVFCW